MKKLLMKGFMVALIIFMAGCQSKEGEKTKEKDKKEVKYKYVLDYSAQNNSCYDTELLGSFFVNGKKLYMINDKDSSQFKGISLMEYDENAEEFKVCKDFESDKSFEMYYYAKNCICDEKNNRVIMFGWEGNKKYVAVYNLETKKFKRTSVDKYTDVIDYIQLIDDNTVALKYNQNILLYDIKSEKLNNIKLTDYVDLSEDVINDHLENIDIKGDNLDIYFRTEYECSTVFRIDLKNKKLLFKKDFASSDVIIYDDYIMVKEGISNSIVDKETLDKKIELSSIPIIGIWQLNLYFRDNEVYIVSKSSGIYKMNLQDESIEHIDSTNGMEISDDDIIGDNIYFIEKNAIYKFGIESNEVEKVADIKKELGWVTNFRMISEDLGYFTEIYHFDSSCSGYERYIWLEKKEVTEDEEDNINEKYNTEEALAHFEQYTICNFLTEDYIDGKPVYIFYSKPESMDYLDTDDGYSIYSGREEYPFNLGYYEGTNEEGYKLYKPIVQDEIEKYNDFKMIKINYNDALNKIVVYAEADSKFYGIIYDLDKNTSSNICISDLTEGTLDFEKAEKILMLDNDNCVVMFMDDLLLCDIKESKVNHVVLSEYTDICKNSIYTGEAATYEGKPEYIEKYNDKYDIYFYNDYNNRMYIARIDLNKHKALIEKDFECEDIIWYGYDKVTYYDKYVEFRSRNQHYIVDKETFSNKIDLKDENCSLSICINGDKMLKSSEDGLISVNLKNMKSKKVECTKGMKIGQICVTDDSTYITTKDAIYKVDIKNNKLEKIYNIEDDIRMVKGLHMYSDDLGYFIKSYYVDIEGYVEEFDGYYWIMKK